MALGSSGSSTGLLPGDLTHPQHKVGQTFLRTKAGPAPYVGAGGIGPRWEGGYPLYGGSDGALADGSERPVGHTQTAQVVQAPSPKDYGAGGGTAAGGVPALYAGHPDLTSITGG